MVSSYWNQNKGIRKIFGHKRERGSDKRVDKIV
jgi:hypothetical protein